MPLESRVLAHAPVFVRGSELCVHVASRVYEMCAARVVALAGVSVRVPVGGREGERARARGNRARVCVLCGV